MNRFGRFLVAAAAAGIAALCGCSASPSLPAHTDSSSSAWSERIAPEIERFRVELARCSGRRQRLDGEEPVVWFARALDAIDRQYVDAVNAGELVDVAIRSLPSPRSARKEPTERIVDEALEAMMLHVDADGRYRAPASSGVRHEPAQPAETGDEVASATITHRAGGCATLRIRRFDGGTTEAVKSALAREGDARGIVLDLRGNRGELLFSAVAVADLFVESGLLAKLEGRGDVAGRRFFATGADDRSAVSRVALVVDEGTAAGAEALAAALKAHRNARVIGARTAGHSTVQTVIPVGPQRALELTTARILDPHGSPFDKGIGPDFAVPSATKPVAQDAADAAMQRAYETIGCRATGGSR